MKTIIVALDFDQKEEMQRFLGRFKGIEKPIVKIGMELFYQYGPRVVKEVQKMGFQIFLDLKMNDIPNTVEKSMFQIAKLGIKYTTVHSLGGTEMMRAAIKGAENGAKLANLDRPKVLAVTELTSISEAIMNKEQGIQSSISEQVKHLIELAFKAGTDGVICSALDLKEIDNNLNGFEFITPGIRPIGFDNADQKRVVTPAEAKKLGSTGIVVGRPITRSKNPVETYQQILKEWGK